MITQRKTANAVGGTTARACESCLRKRARWYCAADEAFLCQSCDASVHSANQLAGRHERIRLENASFKSSTGSTIDNCRPAWHHGFTRKARTPRHPKSKQLHTAPKHDEGKIINSFPLVPEISGEDACLNDDDDEEEEEQLLYRVPVFEPFAVEFCNIGNDTENVHTYERRETYVAENGQDEAGDIDDLHGFLPPDDMDLLESLLGTGTEDETCGIEGLGFIDCKKEEDIGLCFDGNKVKVEGDNEVEAILAYNMDPGLDMTRETLDWNFDYESPVNGEDQEEEQKVEVFAEAKMSESSESKEVVRNKIILNLNYEGVISSWANQGSPWTTGIRPEVNSDDCWPDFMGIGSPGMNHPHAGMGGSDVGRQARVSRYREKRRTRLFSKKIRYEVRKLNAERRPRMKGRFVKRTSFAVGSAANFPLQMMNK